MVPVLGYGGYADECTSANTLTPDVSGNDLDVAGKVSCIGPGTYNYGYVKVRGDGQKEGKLIFLHAKIDFWARSILIENEGSLIAGSPDNPIGTKDINNILTIYLYGGDAGSGIACKTPLCGVPADVWGYSGANRPKVKMPAPDGTPADKIVQDYFYKYENLPTYGDQKDGDYYFGRKTFAVSYGGFLQMFGKKGATYADVNKSAMLKDPVEKGATKLELNRFADWKPGEKILIFDISNPAVSSEILVIKKLENDPSDQHAIITLEGTGVRNAYKVTGNYRVMDMDPSGTSWTRLNGNVDKGGDQLVLDRVVDWQQGDQIVLTATDYLPAHSELLSIKKIDTDPQKNVSAITVNQPVAYPHNGTRYAVPKADMPSRIRDKVADAVETRAAVALLSRNIRIVSGGNQYGRILPDNSYFGGHTIVRQGVKQYQIQGVEFYQLGQGGRMAHSPVNFHMVRQAPLNAFAADCSAWDSMTRWYEIRGTQGVMLNRNVGYKSSGHGYFLAEGTETMNLLQGNIGIYARPAITYPDNPRGVPGVIAKTTDYAEYDCPPAPVKCPDPRRNQYLAYGGDYIHPSVFFIMNGYNNFENNMAVGAGSCGACYWFAPAVNSGLSRNQSWEGYAGIQRQTPGRAPIKSFHGNFCSTAQHSLITIDTTGVCKGVNTPNLDHDNTAFDAIPNPFAKYYDIQDQHDPKKELYPDIQSGAVLQPVRCDVDKNPGCEESQFLCTKGNTQDCAVSVIDSYTSSFHWAQQNFAAIWLRTNWFLFTDSTLTDVLNGGLTMVSGGSWDQVINQYWALTRNSIFVGHTQDSNPYATNAGPVNPLSPLICSDGTPASYCRLQDGNKRDEGVVIPIDNFSVYQRLYNIYDGPVYQESNAFLHIKKAAIAGCDPKLVKNLVPGTCNNNKYLYWRAMGIPRAKENPYKGQCILPNAAVGWKQPNGFYYPPAFHSRNLFFNDVDIRHFIIVPLFKPGTAEVDVAKVKAEYCTYPPDGKDGKGNVTSVNAQFLFADNFTDVDRQTELNDDDGSLTGLKGAAPRQIGAGSDDAGGTISINTDKYFDAPAQTLECLSEETCLQSPYDYITAVVIPDCATQSFGGCGDMWKDVCQDRNCYGVPIYRQYLNSGEKAGDEQSIRMMGTGIAQRSTLVANRGTYYVDTTVSAGKQGAFKNVFEKGRTYNFFFLYAKPTTSVTFQVYVGKNLDKGYLDTSVKMIRVGTEKENGFVLRTTPLTCTPADAWPAQWDKKYEPASGILSVTVDLTSAGFKEQFDKGVKESCGPPSFCKWKDNPGGKGGSCVYEGDQTVIDYKGDDSICQWSVKASECPGGGCYGFQVELTADAADDDANHHRPEPAAFPQNWSSVAWKTADGAIAGDKAQAEKSESLVIKDVDSTHTIINLQDPGITAPGNLYTTVKRMDNSGAVAGWAWLKKDKALETSVLYLDRPVEWKTGDKLTITTPSTCVYPVDNAPPTPAYIWDIATPPAK